MDTEWGHPFGREYRFIGHEVAEEIRDHQHSIRLPAGDIVDHRCEVLAEYVATRGTTLAVNFSQYCQVENAADRVGYSGRIPRIWVEMSIGREICIIGNPPCKCRDVGPAIFDKLRVAQSDEKAEYLFRGAELIIDDLLGFNLG